VLFENENTKEIKLEEIVKAIENISVELNIVNSGEIVLEKNQKHTYYQKLEDLTDLISKVNTSLLSIDFNCILLKIE
jgi:uncharacterized protein YfkK (UPF0435 family)